MVANASEQKNVWITVDQASSLCIGADLPRTTKTIRLWCRTGHVKAQKHSSTAGERWVLDKASLSVKIASEKELQHQFAQVRTSSNSAEPRENKARSPFEAASPTDEAQTRSNGFEQVRTLETKIQSLEIDKAVRDQHIQHLKSENERSREDLLSQSRYIGHLETKVIQFGDVPDQTFLSAPTTALANEPISPAQGKLGVD